jgi:pimeloyl-ACP methyl ester carboxylesterase
MEQKYTHFQGQRIAYYQTGSGPHALLLHGFPTSSYDWLPLMALLKNQRQLWAVDFLGFGYSAKPHPHRYSLFEQADLILDFAQQQHITECDLICHDYGDTVGLEMMQRVKAGAVALKVRSITLLNGSVYFDLVHLRLIQRALLWPMIGPLAAQVMSRRLFGRQFKALFSPQHPIAESELDQHWERLIANQGRRVYPALNRYLNERRQFARQRWEPVLEAMPCPMCAIWGQVDPVAVAAMGERIRERAAGAVVHLLEEVGHYPQLEVPVLVAAKITEFWKTC